MKKSFVAVALVLALLFGFSACSGSKEVVKEYNSSADFAELQLFLEVPEGGESPKYAIVDAKSNGEELKIAQITYDYEGTSCILRTANVGSHNISGYDENKAQSEEQYDLNVEGYSSQIRIMLISGKYVALWTLGEHSYSLCADTSDPLVATSCAIDAANANVPMSVIAENTTVAQTEE